MKITYQQAKNALNTITPPQQLPTGQIQLTKSDLAKAKGDTGVKAYHLKHDIKDAFKAHQDKEKTIGEQYRELESEEKEIRKKEEELAVKKKKLAKKDKDRLNQIEKEKLALDEDFKELNQSEESVTLKKGKFHIEDVKEYLDAVELEALEFAIDFTEKEKAKAVAK